MISKQNFINSEIWILTFGGGLQRANVYKADTKESERKAFRNAISKFIEFELLPDYIKKVKPEDHVSNIEAIIRESAEFESILNGCKLRFGVAQKIFNLYLKYQWCLGNIHEPPHFPVDRIIQTKLESKNIVNWTAMDSAEEYLRIIGQAEKKLEGKQSLAEWELVNFARN